MDGGCVVWRKARYLAFLVALALVPALAGCAPSTGPVAARGAPSPTASASAPSATGTAATPCAGPNCAAVHVQVFVEPEAGEAPIVHAIEGATTSVWVEVYILTDRAVINALEDAARRNVDVRVLLEPHAFGEGNVGAAQTLEELIAAGVQARQADPAFHYTHEKALVVDHATAYQRTRLSARGFRSGNESQVTRKATTVSMGAGFSPISQKR